MSVNVVREMFDEMVIPKDARQIERFYAPSFVMTSNGVWETTYPNWADLAAFEKYGS